MTKFAPLGPHETHLKGRWVLSGRSLIPDEVSYRIEYLKSQFLIKVSVDPSGWKTLYKDPSDGRYWELSFPDSETQGGGPAELKCLGTNPIS